MSAQLGREQLFYRILVFFAVFTAFTGLLNLSQSGQITLGDLGNGYVPGQAAVDMTSISSASGTTVIDQVYTSSTGYLPNLTIVATNAFSGDTWTRSDGVGYEVSYIPVTGNQQAYISVKGLKPENGIYDATYHIYNQFQDHPFYILLAGSSFSSSVSGLYVKYDQQGVYLVNSFAKTTIINSLQFQNANQGTTYRTVYNSATATVQIYIDGSYAGELKDNSASAGGIGDVQCGMAADYTGLQLSEIDGKFTIPLVNDPITALLAPATALFSMFLTVFGLTSNTAVPFWIWAIVGLPCIATLVLIYLELARGMI
jgi:hypothetical protein